MDKKSLFFCVFFCSTAQAELYFDINALHLSETEKQQLNLEELAKIDTEIPGQYNVRIRVNNILKDNELINFIRCDTALCPQLSIDLLAKWGVNIHAIPTLTHKSNKTIITHLDNYIPQAVAKLNINDLILDISIPQAVMSTVPKDEIPPEQWDNGIPMLFVNYNASGYQDFVNHGEQNSNQYLNLRSGLNIGAWRLRSYDTFTHNSTLSSWTNSYSWLQRDIHSWHAYISAGKIISPGLLFDNFTFRGIKLATDDSMLPQSQQGFAPVIDGIALTNATIEVRQNGSLIYQTFVPPGRFVISDLYPTSLSGELQINIIEETGETRTFIKPFSSLPIMVRKGQFKYAFSAGRYDGNRHNIEQQYFAQAETLYGITNSTTLYSGLIQAKNYHSGIIGFGQDLGLFGSLSFDIKSTKAYFNDGKKSTSQSYRLRYNKIFNKTGTIISLSDQYVSNDRYYNFSDISSYESEFFNTQSLIKNRLQLTINQSLNNFGTLSFSTYLQTYWRQEKKDNYTTSITYNKKIHSVNVNLNYINNRIQNNKSENTVSMTLNLPFSALSNGKNYASLNATLSHSDKGRSYASTSLSGSTLEDNNLNYNVNQTWDKQLTSGNKNSSAVSLQYTNSAGMYRLGYINTYHKNQQINWGTQGAIVAHPYGITLSQDLSADSGSTLIRAPQAKSVKIKNYTALYTNSKGYAIASSLIPYRRNEISLDTLTLNDNIDIAEPIKQTIPTKGALTVINYDAKIGRRAFITLIYKDKPIPLGSIVTANDSTGMSNEYGEVYLTGITDETKLNVDLQNGQTCRANFDSKQAKERNGLSVATLVCK